MDAEMLRRAALVVAIVAAAGAAREAAAQIPGCELSRQFRLELVAAGHWRLAGQVEIECAGHKFFADQVDVHTDTGRLVAEGHVVYQTAEARIAAERVEFDTTARTGVFHAASGMASLGARAERSLFGTLEPDVYFYGDRIEVLGGGRYRVTGGGFTTCVQPTPRWEIVAGSATIAVGDYAVLRHAVMRVKDVPVFYVPVLYYPIQDDDRATGFLLPTYGRSTYRGPSLSNAFFWAIDRSQDATFFHDWLFARGQGAGAEYRYQASAGSGGQVRAYWLAERASTLATPGAVVETPDRRSHEVNGSLTQQLPGGLTARGRVDYFSDLAVRQIYHYDVLRATSSQRTAGASVGGHWGGWSVAASYLRTEHFYTAADSIVGGQAPGLSASLSSRRVGTLPLFVAVQADAGRTLYEERRASSRVDRSLNRLDVLPQLRSPMVNAPFLTVTGTLAYRYTWYSQSLDASGRQVPVSLGRRYAQMGAEVVGPVFSRVFTPNNVLAERLKHVIEPAFAVQRTTSIDNQDRVALLGSSYDVVVGGVTRVSYGLTNRVLVRRRAREGQADAGAPRELLAASVGQSYYTDDRASQFDRSFASSLTGRRPSRFSPIAAVVRASPSAAVTNSLRVELDPRDRRVLSLSAGADVRSRPAQVSMAWSRRRLSPTAFDQVLQGATEIRLLDRRVGGTYAFHWDIGRRTLIQQRWIGYYNAQCCGIALEYQAYAFPFADPRFPVPADRRFNLSFTLAGIGTFSNFFGTFGGSRY